MTPEQRIRQLEVVLRVIGVWTADSVCLVCQTVNEKCKEALDEK